VAGNNLGRFVKNKRKWDKTQQSLWQLRQKEWDAIVIGAGPSGSTAAFHLASQGYRVLLVDKDNFPREKVCGDGLIADSLNCLESLGIRKSVENIGHQSKTATIFSYSRIKYKFKIEPFVTIRRKILDRLIVGKAIESGATFAMGKINSVTKERDSLITCSVSGSDKLIRTKVIVIATGTNADLPKKIGMTKFAKATHIAVRFYVRSPFEIDYPVLSYDKSVLPGCGWIFPLGGGDYNIGCCIACCNILRHHIKISKTFREFISTFPLARQILEHAEHTTQLKAGTLCTSLKGAVPYLESKNILAIGESIGTTLPLTGEGIGKAMLSGELAAKVIDEAFRLNEPEHLRKYSSLVNEKLKPFYLSYETAERWLTRFWLNDLSALCLKKSKKLRNTLSGVLEDRREPSEVFSVSGIIKSFWDKKI
jgi:geranylgeranyl reductase family protein